MSIQNGADSGPHALDERFRFRFGTAAELDGGRLVLAWASRHYAVGPIAPGLAGAIEALKREALAEDDLADLAAGDEAARQLRPVLDRLISRGWLERTIMLDGHPLATLRPVASFAADQPAHATRRVALSRFACLRRDGADAILESPRSPAVVVLHDVRLGSLVAELARGVRRSDWADDGWGLPGEAVGTTIDLLSEAGLIVSDDGQSDDEQAELRLAQWNFADLMFHSRSRFGRHGNGFGGTWPMKGRFDPPPVQKPVRSPAIPLPRPDMAVVAAADPSFTAVLDGRRSVREHDDATPITVRQLGEFLYRVARVRAAPELLPDGIDRTYGSCRPYPTGGARYELELYAVVGRCGDLIPAIYRYDPFGHGLSVFEDTVQHAQRILEDGQRRSLMASTPQVLMAITARFGRVMYKYESMAYATILKNVGVLYQTMYCVATAMGLAPCALGGGGADLLANALDLDYFTESSVGEFLLGSRRPAGGS